MKNKEIEKLLKDIKDKYSYEPYDCTGEVYTTISYEEGKLLLSYIEQLEECYCNRTDCIGRIKDSKKYDSLLQKYKQLENNRDKAIEYVEKHTYHDSPKYNGTRIMTQGYLVAKNDFWYEDLLDILKGDNDE